MFGVLFLCGELGRRWNILRGMDAFRGQLIGARWGLPLARSIAKEIGGDKVARVMAARGSLGNEWTSVFEALGFSGVAFILAALPVSNPFSISK